MVDETTDDGYLGGIDFEPCSVRYDIAERESPATLAAVKIGELLFRQRGTT